MERDQMAADEAVERAMARALAAEAEAEAAVARCREEAEALRLAARRRAREIATRTDNRIGLVHKRCSRWNKRRLRALLAEGMAPQEGDFGWSETQLRAAAERLAVALTSGDEAHDPYRMEPL